MAPGLRRRVLKERTNRPSYPLNSSHASPAISRTVGYGGITRCPHAPQNAPFNEAPQLRQRTVDVDIGGPSTESTSSARERPPSPEEGSRTGMVALMIHANIVSACRLGRYTYRSAMMG